MKSKRKQLYASRFEIHIAHLFVLKKVVGNIVDIYVAAIMSRKASA